MFDNGGNADYFIRKRIREGERMTVRKHGSPPYRAVAVHGGPGAAGSAAGLAEGLAAFCGTLEPYQSQRSINGQIEELREQIAACFGENPAVLVGHSWGAWLCAMTAARYPECVSKLILVGAGPLGNSYVKWIESRRLAHFSEEEKHRYHTLLRQLEGKDISGAEKDSLLGELGSLCEKADTFHALPPLEEPVTLDGELYGAVFPEAAEMRRNGLLLDVFAKIRCPLCIVHGAYDTHPSEGLTEPLSKGNIPYHFYLLERCGHTPWNETYARLSFFEILKREIESAVISGSCVQKENSR